MAVGKFSDTNLALAATLQSAHAPILPLANMQDERRYVTRPARFDATDLARSQFEILLPDLHLVTVVGLLFHTMTLEAKVRLTIAGLDDPTYAAPVLQTGWRYVYPSIYDPVDLEAGAENFVTGTVTQAEVCEVLELDAMLQALRENLPPRTLVLVTTDHNNGGLAINGPPVPLFTRGDALLAAATEATSFPRDSPARRRSSASRRSASEALPLTHRSASWRTDPVGSRPSRRNEPTALAAIWTLWARSITSTILLRDPPLKLGM